MSDHNPQRPSWSCTGCGDPWPCISRKRQLVAEYQHDPTALRVYMAVQFADAAQDLGMTPAGVLWVRVVGWVWPVHLTSQLRARPYPVAGGRHAAGL
jgi:hypothetical protein